jgi:hypothetical protein
MAVGDVTVFHQAKEDWMNRSWLLTDEIWCGLVTSATAPVVGEAAPSFTATYTEVATHANYVTGGLNLGALSVVATFDAGSGMIFDSATNPSWTAHASGNTAAWGIIYNTTATAPVANPCIAFVELGAVDMSAGDLTITWAGTGIFTVY